MIFCAFCGYLPWDRFTGFRDANPVIRELRVHAGQFDFWHVAGRAFVCAHRTRGRSAWFGFRIFRLGEMTCKTLRVVISRVFLQLLVRIVAGQASDSRIVGVMPAAIEHTIRLETNIVDGRLTRHEHRRLETRMTRSAERLRKLVPAQAAGIENLRLFKLLHFHGN